MLRQTINTKLQFSPGSYVRGVSGPPGVIVKWLRANEGRSRQTNSNTRRSVRKDGDVRTYTCLLLSSTFREYIRSIVHKPFGIETSCRTYIPNTPWDRLARLVR